METLSTKVPPWMMQRINEYAEEIDETRSTAARELIHAGLEGEEEGEESTGLPSWYVVALLGWMFVSAAFLEVSTTTGYVGAALVVLSVLEGRLDLLDRLA